jgi:hypothetical protein
MKIGRKVKNELSIGKIDRPLYQISLHTMGLVRALESPGKGASKLAFNLRTANQSIPVV